MEKESNKVISYPDENESNDIKMLVKNYKRKKRKKMTFKQRFKRNIKILMIIIVFSVSGTMTLFLYKLQNEMDASILDGSKPVQFRHPFTQTLEMFFGMMIVGGCVYVGKRMMKMCWRRLKGTCRRKEKKKVVFPKVVGVGEEKKDVHVGEQEEESSSSLFEDDVIKEDQIVTQIKEEEPTPVKIEKKKVVNRIAFLLPSICDAIGTTLLLFSLLLTYASVTQMLMTATVPFTFFLSIVLLRKKEWKFPHLWLGMVLVCVGVTLVALNNIFNSTESAVDVKGPIIGTILVVISALLQSLYFILEERFLHTDQYNCETAEVIGLEGAWGFLVVAIVLVVLFLIPGKDFGHVESFPHAIAQMIDNPMLGGIVISLILNIGIFNIMGGLLTKNVNAMSRSVVGKVKGLFIWIIQMARGKEYFSFLQLFGFIILLVGVIIYNEVGFRRVIPCYMGWVRRTRRKDKEIADEKKKNRKGILEMIKKGILSIGKKSKVDNTLDDQSKETLEKLSNLEIEISSNIIQIDNGLDRITDVEEKVSKSQREEDGDSLKPSYLRTKIK